MIMTLVWIILDILKIYLAFCLLQATWWWPMILLFSRNRDSKFAQSRAMKMLSRQALFLLLHAGKLVATGQRQRLKAPYGHGASGVSVAWCGAAVRTLLWKPLRHSWGCRARYRTRGCHASYRTGGCHTTEALQQQWRSATGAYIASKAFSGAASQSFDLRGLKWVWHWHTYRGGHRWRRPQEAVLTEDTEAAAESKIIPARYI